VEEGAGGEREQALEDYEGGAAGEDLEFVLDWGMEKEAVCSIAFLLRTSCYGHLHQRLKICVQFVWLFLHIAESLWILWSRFEAYSLCAYMVKEMGKHLMDLLSSNISSPTCYKQHISRIPNSSQEIATLGSHGAVNMCVNMDLV
jgi:hypothetical protein